MAYWKLTEDLRRELRQPFDVVLDTVSAISLATKKRASGSYIASVGDVCSYELISQGFVPNLVVYDGFSLREPADEHIVAKIEDRCDAKTTDVINMAGTVNRDAFEVIKNAFSMREHVCIKVDGEEDLLALACIIAARHGDVVMYGQPNEGIVLITIDSEVKLRAFDFFARMEWFD